MSCDHKTCLVITQHVSLLHNLSHNSTFVVQILGVIGYIKASIDLSRNHDQEVGEIVHDDVLSQATRARKAARHNMVGVRYIESFDRQTLSDDSSNPGRRIYTKGCREIDQPLPQEDAYGH